MPRAGSIRLLIGTTALMLLAAGLTSGGAPAATKRSGLIPLPHWLSVAENQTLTRVFGGARPIHTYYILYPRKIAVVFEFDRVVRCGICSSPSVETQPRGRVIRVSFDRTTHRLGGASDGWAMRFCEVKDGKPPKSLCLRR